jgi:L-cysteine:1D-myo-inositol 2-amino-2-deoxy-alpha-D-glucopyranoside ligase
MAIRLALLAHHYRADWEWTDDVPLEAERRLDRWRAAVAPAAPAPSSSVSSSAGAPSQALASPAAEAVLAQVRERLADDLDAPGAVAAIDAWAGTVLGGPVLGGPVLGGPVLGGPVSDGTGPQDAALVRDVADALLGVAL